MVASIAEYSSILKHIFILHTFTCNLFLGLTLCKQDSAFHISIQASFSQHSNPMLQLHINRFLIELFNLN